MSRPPLPEHLEVAHGEDKLMSFSRIRDTKCMLEYMFKRIDKILVPPTRALMMGAYNDALINQTPDLNEVQGLGIGDLQMVYDKTMRYVEKHVDYEADVLQELVWAHAGDGVHMHGYVDIVKPDGTPIDNKFTERKLKPVRIKKDGTPTYKAKDGWEFQGRCYLWMKQQMGCDVKEFHFHVLNAEDDELIIIKYKPKQSSIDAVRGDVLNAYELIRSELYWPTIGRHCSWCGHQKECEEFRTRRLDYGT